MMNYESFKELLLKELQHIDSNYSYRIVRKDETDQEYLVSQKQGTHTKTSQEIMESYLTYLKEGSDIIPLLAKGFYSYIIAEESIPNHGNDFEAIKDSIHCRLVNPKRYPHMQHLLSIPYLDLAVIFYLDFGICGIDFSSCCILMKNCLEKWQVSVQEIFETAKQNLEKRQDFEVYSVAEALADLSAALYIDCSAKKAQLPRGPYYFISSSEDNCTAAVLLRPDIFEEIARKEHMDLALVPLSEDMIAVEPLQKLSQKQFAIQQTYQNFKETLSDKIYLYRQGSGQIFVYPNDCNLEDTRYE